MIKRLRHLVFALSGAAALIGPAAHGETLDFHFRETLTFENNRIPINFTVRLRDVAQTRLRTDLFVDLLPFQEKLPEVVEGPLYDDCEFGVSLDLDSLTPSDSGAGAVVEGLVTLRLNSCWEEEGITYRQSGLSAQVDFAADIFGEVSNNCLVAGLRDVELNVKGLIGVFADLFGIVEKAKSVIDDVVDETLTRNPICPDLPEPVAILKPHFDVGGLRTLPSGSLGAQIAGTVEVSATSLIGIIKSLDEAGAFDAPEDDTEEECACAEAAASGN